MLQGAGYYTLIKSRWFPRACIIESVPDPLPDLNSNLPGCGMCCEMGVGTAVTLGRGVGLPSASPSSFESCLLLSAMATISFSVNDEMSDDSDSTFMVGSFGPLQSFYQVISVREIGFPMLSLIDSI